MASDDEMLRAFAVVANHLFAETELSRAYNVSRAAFGLILNGTTGKRKGTQNTICHTDHLLALRLFANAPVKSGGRRSGTTMSALRCSDWTRWLSVADELGFERTPPLGAPPQLPEN